MTDARTGLVGRCDNKGLGNMTWEFCRHVRPAKTMIILNKYSCHLERIPDAYVVQAKRPNDRQLEQFFDGLDVAVILETPYNTDMFRQAKKMGVKTVLIPMFEFFNERWDRPDLYLCVSKTDYDTVPGNKVYLPWPVNDEVLARRRPERARKFLFNTGHGGTKNRNSLDEFYEATRLVRADVGFLVNSQRHHDVDNYWDLWHEGDVFVFPHKFAGLGLPIQEAMAVGLPVITTDFYPFNEFIPRELLMRPDSITREVISREINFYNLRPRTIAAKIDEVAGWPPEKIGELSDRAYEHSQTMTWKKLLPKYVEIFNNLAG